MNRSICVYLVSDDPFYCRMALTSIIMLRQYNKEIKVRVFIIGNRKTKIDDYAEQLRLEVVHRPPTPAAQEYNYFCLNREYLAECKEETILYIDSDTFIFGNVDSICERYQDVDFAAAQDDWIINTPDWQQQHLLESYAQLGVQPVPVFNGGLTLWNKGCVRDWAKKLAITCKELYERKYVLTPWLFGDNRGGYHRETFAICFYIAKKGLRYQLMDNKDVVNLFAEKDWRAWNNKDYIVYHCFTQNWQRLERELKCRNKNSRKKLSYLLSKGSLSQARNR